MTRMITVQAVAERNSRTASELLRRRFAPEAGLERVKGKLKTNAMSARVGRSQQIAEPADGLNDVDAELFTNASDEHFDGVRIAIEILIVQMLDQFGTRDHAAGVMHQI